ncbi:MAG TPA: hypothetical protein DCY79_12865 [Planctomycetaceae bacterium]|nr:hypothetical protein [Blastopirellula sp.]HAY80691.1 hypothetical protein [Planctomycetaceae bacterium]|tara:strand:+ start:433 stop:1071 length:639 start_codon:yes stop_codon:yes gene_type:complete
MHSILLLATLSLNAADLEDGTLLYLTNSNRVVETVTQSDVSHVAIVLNIDGIPYVYEATPAVVRRISLGAYQKELAESNRRRKVDMQLYAKRPKQAFTGRERKLIKGYLDQQIDRRYSVKSFVWKKPTTGIHCAELVATALHRCQRKEFVNSASLSPHSLVTLTAQLYQPPVAVAIPHPRSDLTWCQRSWVAWSSATRWCKWACVEVWTFCW